MKDKICEAYVNLRRKCFDYGFGGNFEVVIKMSHKAFYEFMAEYSYIYKDSECECFHIQLFGFNTPIILDNELPKEVEFQIQERKAYEKEEEAKLFTRLNKMFEERIYR